MSSLLTKITSTVTNAYQEAELSLLTGKAGKVARAVKAAAGSVSTVCHALLDNMSKDTLRRLAKETVEPLHQGIPADCILITGQLASPWGYIVPSLVATGLVVDMTASLAKSDAQFRSHFLHTEAGKSVVQAATFAMYGPVYGPPLFTAAAFYNPHLTKALKNYLPYPARSFIDESLIEWVSSFKAPQIMLGSACVYLLGGTPGITVSHLLYKGLSSAATYFQPIFESNYSRVEMQLFVKYVEGKNGSTVVMNTVMQYLVNPSEEEQGHGAAAALYDRTASAAVTNMPHQKTD